MIYSRLIRAVLACSLVLLCNQPLHGLQSNDNDPEPPRWRASVDLAFDGSRGNEENILFNTGGRISHVMGDLLELRLAGQVRYGWTVLDKNGLEERQTVARNARTQLEVDFLPGSGWAPFTYGSAERNPLRQLDLRLNAGAGGRYTPWSSDYGQATLSVALLYVLEDFGRLPSATDRSRKSTARWSWRPELEVHLSPGMRMTHSTLYQPLWNTMENHLVHSETALRIRLTERVGVTVTYQFDRDSMARQRNAENNDHLLRTGFDFHTQW